MSDRQSASAGLSAVFVIGTLAAMLTLPPLVTPCATEDSYGCVWNASTSGNGVGQSFVTYGGESAHITIPLP